MPDELEEEDRHLRERAVESNFALWNALLTVNGVLTAIFASAAVFQAGWTRWVFAVIVVVSMTSAALLIRNFQVVRDLYDFLGQRSDQDIASLNDTTNRQQIDDADRSRRGVRRREHVVKLCLVLQAVFILAVIGIAGYCDR